MRTAEEYLKDLIHPDGMIDTYADDVIDKLNEARKECLVEAAKKCKGGSMMGEDEIAYKVLSLIDEIK